ncbi:MAG: DUF368 domain-containing protein [Oscillospiraceae bacterium]|nr:DUF368 domain-containing protein [Oscillospiraceae bacterium]
MEFIKRLFIRTFAGAFLGISVFAPGISGSVVAIAMGVYHDIVRIASNPLKIFKKDNMLFLAPIAIGMVVSAIGLVVLFPELFAQYQKTAFLLFTGLIAGNLPMIYAEVKPYTFRASHGVAGFIAFVSAVGIMLLSIVMTDTATMGVTSAWWLFLVGGLVAGMLTLVPGMSIATLLIVMGIYHQVVYASGELMSGNAVGRVYEVYAETGELMLISSPGTMYWLALVLFVVGVVAGLVLVAKSIAKCFEKWPGPSHSSVLGFMAGSLVGMAIMAIDAEQANFSWIVGFIALLVGVGISIGFMVMGKKMNTAAE